MDISGPIDVSSSGEIVPVEPPAEFVQLAFTGVEVFGMVAVALLLIVFGTLIVKLARR